MLTSDEEKEQRAIAKEYPQNPFIYQSRLQPYDFSIGFKTPTKKTNEPLWWTSQGFKNLVVVNLHPVDFENKNDAENKIPEILDHIRKWRPDQIHLIIGWPEHV